MEALFPYQIQDRFQVPNSAYETQFRFCDSRFKDKEDKTMEMDCSSVQSDSNRDDPNGPDSDNISVSEPINLKENDLERQHSNHDWESLNLIKSKTFTIKDILGLDENDKSKKVQCDLMSGSSKHEKILNRSCKVFQIWLFFFSRSSLKNS